MESFSTLHCECLHSVVALFVCLFQVSVYFFLSIVVVKQFLEGEEIVGT